MYIETLSTRIHKTGSRLCAGLDPHRVRQFLDDSNALCEWSLAFIDCLHDIVPAFKFQYAYYEAFGPAGLSVLKEAIDYANALGAVTILDSKRSDIETTLMEFIETAFPILSSRPFCWNVNAVTLNPYLGLESIPTILKRVPQKPCAIYMLLTPTAGNRERLGSQMLSQFECITESISSLGSNWSRGEASGQNHVALGYVVSAIDLDRVNYFSQSASVPLLIPGVGYQGAGFREIAPFVTRHEASIFNVSRALYPNVSYNDASWRSELRSRAISFTV